jgi:hypothetical protein
MAKHLSEKYSTESTSLVLYFRPPDSSTLVYQPSTRSQLCHTVSCTIRMSVISCHLHIHDLQVTTFVSYVVDTCTGAVRKTIEGGKSHLTVKGKHNRACRILVRASIDLSHIQASLDDKQKEQFSSALALYVRCIILESRIRELTSPSIEQKFNQLCMRKGLKRREAASRLLDAAKDFETTVIVSTCIRLI